MSRFRNACFTWNNFPDDVDDLLTQLPTHDYIVYAREMGDSGTPHIQGYVEFTEAVRFTTLKKRFPKVHWEKRRGTSQQAADYCKKDGDFKEEGTISNQGKRTDIETVRDQLKTEGATMRTIIDTAKSCQSIRFAEVYLKFHEKARDFKPTVTWLYGKPGTGKTLRARRDAEARGFSDDIHTQTESAKWWDGYDGHKVVIMDDLRENFCTFVRMLNLLDRYPCRIECKGGSRQLVAEHIYITAPFPPEEMWKTKENMDQLLRRIDNIEEIKSITDSIIHKGNGIPNYQEEAILKEEESNESEAIESDYSYQEVCSEISTTSGDERKLVSR